MTRPADEWLEFEHDRQRRRADHAVNALARVVAERDAEREGRLRAEAQVRALEEALGEALEALYEATTTPEDGGS